MQYDNNMTATYLLEEDEEQNFTRRNANRSESSSSTSSGDSSESTGLRSRKKDGKSQSEEGTSTPSTSSNKFAPKDPLFWFGFLPSQTLRKSQQSFISGKTWISLLFLVHTYLCVQQQTLWSKWQIPSAGCNKSKTSIMTYCRRSSNLMKQPNDIVSIEESKRTSTI